MTDIAIERLYNQQIVAPRLTTPGDVVSWLGAVQAQEVWGGKWTIGLRLPGSTEADIDAAIAAKHIVRLFFMRGTLHYLPAADARWMLSLVADRVHRLMESAARYNKTGLDETAFRTGSEAIARALEGGKQLIRDEMKAALIAAGITTSNMGYMFLIQRAQLDGVACYGLDRGKQQTWTLMDEWLPPSPMLDREAGLAEFARRFFQSRGPATIHDFANWGGLTIADAKAGHAAVRAELVEETIGDATYYFMPPAERPPFPAPDAHLLPTYDEFIIGYKDRSASVTPEYGARWAARTDHNVSPMVLNGRAVGAWWRTVKPREIIFHLEPFEPLPTDISAAFEAAARRYAAFLGLDAVFED